MLPGTTYKPQIAATYPVHTWDKINLDCYTPGGAWWKFTYAQADVILEFFLPNVRPTSKSFRARHAPSFHSSHGIPDLVEQPGF
jgi:hypothetical protein